MHVTTILFQIFPFTSISDIGLNPSIILLSLSVFITDIILATENGLESIPSFASLWNNFCKIEIFYYPKNIEFTSKIIWHWPCFLWLGFKLPTQFVNGYRSIQFLYILMSQFW